MEFLMVEFVELEDDPSNIFGKLLYNEDTSFLSDIDRKNKPRRISISVKCVYPDPENPDELIPKSGTLSMDCNKPVSQIEKDFLATYPEIPNQSYFVGYDQLLFREGSLAECGITHGKSVELISPGKNAAAYHNEGLSLVVWSILPLVIGITSIIFSMTTDSSVSNDYQALFLIIGLVFIIPSLLITLIGLILIPEAPMPCYFIGTEWC